MPSMTTGANAGSSGPGAFNAAGGAPVLNTDVINNLLQQFGVMLPPGGFSDAGPFQQAQENQQQGGDSLAGKLLGGHPGVARAMDNALISAALTKPGRSTGENISNAAAGILGVAPFRRQLQSEQAQVPLEFAKTIGGLQQQQAMMGMYSGLGDYYRQMGQANVDRGQAALERNQTQMNIALMREQVAALKQPVIGRDGVVQEWQFTDPANPLSGQYLPNPAINPNSIRTQQHIQNLGAPFQVYLGEHGGQMPDPTSDPVGYAKFMSGFHQQELDDKIKVASANTMFAREAPPPQADVIGKSFDSAKTAQTTLLNGLNMTAADKKTFESGLAKQIFAQGYKSPDGRVVVAPGDYAGSQAAAAQQAQQEYQRRALARQGVAQAGSEYQNMIVHNLQQAQQYGTLQGYLQQQYGYDFKSNTFATQPGTGPAQQSAQAPNPMTVQRPAAAALPKGTTGAQPSPTPTNRDPLGLF